MDRGFYSGENLRFLTEQGCRFIIALPGSLKYCTELIRKHRDEIINHSEYMLGKGLPYGNSYKTAELGFRMKVHLYDSPEKAVQESKALHELLERQEKDLSQMEEPPDRKLHYDKFSSLTGPKRENWSISATIKQLMNSWQSSDSSYWRDRLYKNHGGGTGTVSPPGCNRKEL